jgi:PhzF family phenazine biosynthesis protein
MDVLYYHVDSFSARPFGGNPAGVCLLENWLSDAVMQRVAAENRHSETAFVVPEDEGWAIRWFSPTTEVALCGHATLAAAFALWHSGRGHGERLAFGSKSGPLAVTREGDLIWLDFPAAPIRPCPVPAMIPKALGLTPKEAFEGRFLSLVLETEAEVAALRPDLTAIAEAHAFAVLVTAPGQEGEYVLRCFGPRAGIPEDPVTGAAQCDLAPYWARRLNRRRLNVRQRSERGGELIVEAAGERVRIGGRAALYLRGMLSLP